MMLLKTSLITFSIVFLFGCVGVPAKPVIEVCVIDKPREECICGLNDGQGIAERKPLEYCDRATSFPPSSWERVQNYIDEMELYIQNGCQ